MDSLEAPQLDPKVAQDLLATFGAMAPHLTGSSERPSGEERDNKKAKLKHVKPTPQGDQDLLRLLGNLAIRMDQEIQQLHKQASFVFFMQTEKDAILDTLTSTAKKWQHDMQGGAAMQTQDYKPLRAVLFQCLLMNLNQRLLKLSQCQPADQMFQTALQQGLLTAKGNFHFTSGMRVNNN